jgi:DNA-binding protein HU-beta
MPKRVTKESLAQSMSDTFGYSKKQSMELVNHIFNEMADALAQNGTAEITGFGKFDLFYRKERLGYNPATKEKMAVDASYVPKFHASATLKNKCNKD